jgi:hypothetical protein
VDYIEVMSLPDPVLCSLTAYIPSDFLDIRCRGAASTLIKVWLSLYAGAGLAQSV